MQLDHVVISVPSLKDGISQFTSLGFEVTPGGSHGATENALISFADGTYIELLALKSGLTKTIVKLCSSIGLLAVLARRRPDVYRRLIPWLSAAPGPLDWRIRVDDISAALSRWSTVAVTRNVSQLAVRYFERTLPDGRVAQWHLGSPTDFELPFLLCDVSEISIRVPPRTTPHPNGALGIQTLSLATADIARFEGILRVCIWIKQRTGASISAG